MRAHIDNQLLPVEPFRQAVLVSFAHVLKDTGIAGPAAENEPSFLSGIRQLHMDLAIPTPLQVFEELQASGFETKAGHMRVGDRQPPLPQVSMLEKTPPFQIVLTHHSREGLIGCGTIV
ncbi:MAG: hypothetical protein U1G07_19885 [Verrucomicrobiota bacterium]